MSVNPARLSGKTYAETYNAHSHNRPKHVILEEIIMCALTKTCHHLLHFAH